MRIIAGKFKGKKLAKSNHLESLRPTTDRSRESLFNILSSQRVKENYGFNIASANILDICCGTGAIAFEAISRGAKFATLVDKDPKHLDLAKKNGEILGILGQTNYLNCDATKIPKNNDIYNLIFIDPPYDQDYQKFLKGLEGIISKESLVILESRSSSKSIDPPLELKILEERVYGQSRFNFLKKSL